MAAGAMGGLVASLAMNQFQAAVTAVSESMARKERQRKKQPKPEENPEHGGDDATVKAAQAISTATLDHELSQEEKKWAGPAIHYGLGTALGAVYGAFAIATSIETGAGMGYGAAVWLGADEIAVPLLGLAEPPRGNDHAIESIAVMRWATATSKSVFRGEPDQR
jgi:hypothetical protein